jgi:sulfur carrier protein
LAACADAASGIFVYFQTRIDSIMLITINGKARNFDFQQCNVTDLVTHLALVGKRLAIERNGEIIPRSHFAETFIHDGDKLEIVGAVGGG